MAEHRLAHILRAIADGKIVQFQRNEDDQWVDFNPDVSGFPIYNPHLTWRIKPKPKVKKWRWVVKEVATGELSITGFHYSSEKEYNSVRSRYVAVQPVTSTMIEVEEDDE